MLRLQKLSVIYLALAVLASEKAHGRQDLIPGSRYTSGRAAALGDTGLTSPDDVGSGLFYNPAILGKIRKPVTELFDLSFNGSLPYLGMLTDSEFYRVTSLSGFAGALSRHPGQTSDVGASFLPSFGIPGFSIGILFQNQLRSVYSNGNITYTSIYQFIPAIGTGFKLFHGILRFGYSIQFVNEAVGTVTVSGADPNIGYNQQLPQGSALSHTAGLTVTVPTILNPSLSFVGRNLFNTHYNSFSLIKFSPTPNGTPPDEPMTFDCSLKLQPRLGRGVAISLEAIDRDITNRAGVPLMAHLGLGVEFIINDKIFLRGGFASGYPSAGFGLRKPTAEIAVTYYTEEIGNSYLSQGDSHIFLHYQFKFY